MFRIRPFRLGFLVLGIVLALGSSAPAAPAGVHELRGRVLDKSSLAPLPKVAVGLLETKLAAETGPDGTYRIADVPNGTYQVLFEKDGYLPIVTRVRVSGEKKEFVVDASLEALRKEITVTADTYARAETAASSRQSLSGAEARSLPGVFEDVSRALQVIPGVATSGDFKNDLIVRGGSPGENLFLLDSIMVPGLSHFSSQNSSGGFFGVLNANLVKDLDFYSGGFPAIYGDRLSSVTRVGLREGDRSRLSGRLNLSLFGATGTFEGPLPAGLGSWIASLRKDYFGIIPRGLTLGMTVIPDLADAQTKIVVDLSPRLQLSLVGLGAVDQITIDESDGPVASRMHMEIRDRLDIYGATLKSILGRFGVAYFTLSRTRSLCNYTETRNGQENYAIRTDETDSTAHFDLELSPLPRLQIMSGVSYQDIGANDRSHFRGGYTVIDRMGFRFTRADWSHGLSSAKGALYVQASATLGDRLKLTAGLRGDYFRYTGETTVSPRLGLNYLVRQGTEVHLSYGVYYQSPETFWLNSHPSNTDLRALRAEHAVLGIEHEFAKDLKAGVEIYDKRYHNYPVDPSNPFLTLANQGGSLVPTFFGSRLVGAGTGYARGIEFSLREAPTGTLSWLVNYSYAVVKYRALDGVLRNGDFDFRHILNAVATYRLSGTLEISARWRYLGGQPYTPFDMGLTVSKNDEYFDMTKINEYRYPAYHRLDVRLEKRFIFKKWSLDVYLDVQNVYNRKNIYYKFWDDGQEKSVYFFPIIPFLGIQAGF
jgi:outer membrane receptor protein involved in Fe transport